MADTIVTITLTGPDGLLRPVKFVQRDDGSVYPLNGPMPFSFKAVHADTAHATPGDAKELVPFDANRRILHVFNRASGAETIDLGPDNTVTENGGIPVYSGGSFTFDGAGACGPFYVVSPVSSTAVSWVEG